MAISPNFLEKNKDRDVDKLKSDALITPDQNLDMVVYTL